jgi:hypothetical protein
MLRNLGSVRSGLVTLIVAALVVLVSPALAAAQQATLAGAVTDASGAALPGVTIEASSPALIEKTRGVVTDGTGQYRIVGLPSGTYVVSFALPGFNTVKREGVELAGALTVTVDTQMRIGAIEESVVVTGESPIVDVQNARRQQIIDGPVLATLPTSRSYNSVLQLVPSVTAGDGNLQLRPTMLLFTAYGGSAQDGRLTVDGINTGSSRGGSGVSSYVPDIQNATEVAFSISGNLGEAETGGPQMTVVPKTGGNRFNGTFVANGVNQAMQGSNFTSRLRNAGLTAPPKVIKLFDVQASAGGPVKRDRLWFYFNFRRFGSADAQPGIFANANAGDPTKWTYVPDLSQQGRTDVARSIYALRLTWQATPRHKIMGFFDYQPECIGAAWIEESGACRNRVPGDGWILGGSQINNFFGAGPNAPETGDYSYNPNRVEQLKWQAPMTNRLLLEAAGGITWSRWGYESRPGSLGDELVRVQEQAAIPGVGLAGLKYRSSNRPHGRSGAHTWNASASYVTGAHSMKVGYMGGYMHDIDTLFNIINNRYRVSYRFNNTVPNQITQQAGEFERQVNTEYAAFYGQEQWTRGRVTLQGALRYDRAWSHFPEQYIGPDVFIPTRIVVPAETGVRGFHNVSPRMGAAWDVRGDGRTSLKAYFGKYLSPATNQNRFVLTNPVERITTIVNRQWTDANADYAPQCDLMNAAQNGECGAWLDQTFGRPRPSTNFDPGILGGWGIRPGDWQLGLSMQRQVLPGTSVEVAYARRWWINFADVTDNLAVSRADYDPFSIVAPADSRLPGGGGYTIGGLYDLNPSRLGQTDNLVRAADFYGGHTRYYDAVDVNVNARLGNGVSLQGGTSTGRLVSDQCAIRDQVPEFASGALVGPVAPYCRQAAPFLTNYRALATYTVPKIDVLVSGTFSSRPGGSLSANLVVPSAQIAPTLGRPLSGGANTTINLLAPNTLFGDRITQLDTRIGKVLRAGASRATVALDVLNALNSDAILAYNPTFNASWPTPTTVITARLVRASVQYDW